MELRAHHLLCIEGYHGVGYSKEFVDNMNKVVDRLEDNPSEKVIIVSKCDTLCKVCPGKTKEGLCISQNLVAQLDEKTLNFLNINEGEYLYEQLDTYIKENLTWETYVKICSKCEWFKNNVCSLKEKFQI